MELRHLRYFVALAAELNFSAAAVRLGISQSALSQQIAALERELGIKLVSRSARKTGLTRAGHVFLDAAQRILDDAEAAVASARATAEGVGPNLTIGISGFSPRDFLNWLEETNRERDLGFSTLLRVLSLQRIVDDLQANKLDLGLVRLPLPNSVLRHKVILNDPLVAVVSRRHLFAEQGALPLSLLRNETFFEVPIHRGGYFPYIKVACAEAGFTPARTHQVDTRQDLLTCVAAGRGVTLLPLSWMDPRWKDLSVLELTDVSICADLAVAWQPGLRVAGTAVEDILAAYPRKQITAVASY